MSSAIAEVREAFSQAFGGDGRIHLIRAPGRVNLIGEHTDYNEGFVFPMAIEPQVLIACRARDDALVRIRSTAFSGSIAELSLDRRIERGEPAWANYSRGVAAELIAAGIPLVGMDALISNSLPVGSGLSSSAALEVGTARSLLVLAGSTLDDSRLALLCQKAEHTFANVPVGIMDQTIVAAGRAGHAMLLDCRDLSRRFVPIDSNELRVVIVNSMVKHALVDGEYAKRHQQCEQATDYFHGIAPAVRALRDVSIQQVEAARGALADVIFRRARHVVTENARTTQAAVLLAQRNYEELGELMVQSHRSLRDDYEVSCRELDFLADQAMTTKGVYGARMTGGGFGGCIVALVQPRSVESLTGQLLKSYAAQFGFEPQVYVTDATAGANQIETVQKQGA
ncbi:MAG TPA: galactokinase [Bradyrhizobium sp.]